jgi:hypothetical protein
MDLFSIIALGIAAVMVAAVMILFYPLRAEATQAVRRRYY